MARDQPQGVRAAQSGCRPVSNDHGGRPPGLAEPLRLVHVLSTDKLNSSVEHPTQPRRGQVSCRWSLGRASTRPSSRLPARRASPRRRAPICSTGSSTGHGRRGPRRSMGCWATWSPSATAAPRRAFLAERSYGCLTDLAGAEGWPGAAPLSQLGVRHVGMSAWRGVVVLAWSWGLLATPGSLGNHCPLPAASRPPGSL
jgi:hypothetical protein